MHHGNRPRELRDISHLYLSRTGRRNGGDGAAEALVLLASLGGGPMRAWLASGLASAAASTGAKVTLLEAGEGLPNAGYYFALPPREYMRPVLDRTSAVEIDGGRGLKVLSVRDPAVLRYTDGSQAGPGLTVCAFDWPCEAGLDVLAGPFAEGAAAMLLVVSEAYGPAAEELRRGFGELFPGSPVKALCGEREADWPEGFETSPVPHTMLEGLGRRRPPVSAYLDGLAAELLQRLGSRRKGTGGERTG
jgi:hypothetical protein